MWFLGSSARLLSFLCDVVAGLRLGIAHITNRDVSFVFGVLLILTMILLHGRLGLIGSCGFF